MRKLIVFILVLVISATCYGAEIAGVSFDDKITIGGESLILNGVGLRKKLLVKVYAAGLYLKQKATDPYAIIEADDAMAIVLRFIHDEVSQENLIKAWKEGFEKSTKGQEAKIHKEIEVFNSLFNAPARKGDVYEFAYVPKEGTIIKINGKELKKLPGLEFKKALFGIWLCDEPADASLKNGLLGSK